MMYEDLLYISKKCEEIGSHIWKIFEDQNIKEIP